MPKYANQREGRDAVIPQSIEIREIECRALPFDIKTWERTGKVSLTVFSTDMSLRTHVPANSPVIVSSALS